MYNIYNTNKANIKKNNYIKKIKNLMIRKLTLNP